MTREIDFSEVYDKLESLVVNHPEWKSVLEKLERALLEDGAAFSSPDGTLLRRLSSAISLSVGPNPCPRAIRGLYAQRNASPRSDSSREKATTLFNLIRNEVLERVSAQDFMAEAFSELAERGNACAQYYTGLDHLYGYYFDQDYKVAVYWFTLSAEQGDEFSQFELGCCYLDGIGVKQDFVKAYAWLSLAIDRGFEEALDRIEKGMESMTPEQISKGQELFREYADKYTEKETDE